MKIGLGEIWNFSKLIDVCKQGWSFNLVTGHIRVSGLSHHDLLAIRSDEWYDTELLPLIFTFREILWQPDVFAGSAESLPALRILKAHCEEVVESYEAEEHPSLKVYAQLLRGIVMAVSLAIEELGQSSGSTRRVLGDMRVRVFPIIKFFIFHPRNRGDYFQDALNRLNYAVKIMLTQFDGKYTELRDPYWEVIYDTSKRIEQAK